MQQCLHSESFRRWLERAKEPDDAPPQEAAQELLAEHHMMTCVLIALEHEAARLVTGSEFDFEQGVGAIDFGTYIAPRVFVSYGLGLFETENVIRVRYDLKRGFGITATSGEKETGVDLSYRIER